MLRTAFVLGAGLGTRLKSLTSHRPKPLIPVANKPLITFAFDHLLASGVERLVVNTHWHSQAYATEFREPRYRGASLAFRDEQPEVLETAGGIKNVEDLLGDEPFLVYNGDILSDLPLERLIAEHADRGNEVTLALRSKDGPLQISLDEATGQVTDIRSRLGAPQEPKYLFTGIYVVSPAFLKRIPAATKISVIPIFLDMIRAGARIGGVVIDEGRWWDLGTREQYLAVHRELATGAALRGEHWNGIISRAPWVAAGVDLSGTTKVSGATAIGAGARIGENVLLADSIVWPGAEIAAGSQLRDCIVTGAVPVSGNFEQADL